MIKSKTAHHSNQRNTLIQICIFCKEHFNYQVFFFSESSQNVTFHRTHDIKTFPGPPSKPTVVEVLTHSIKLSWQPNNNHGDSPVYAYIVEYFSHETSGVKKKFFVAQYKAVVLQYNKRDSNN